MKPKNDYKSLVKDISSIFEESISDLKKGSNRYVLNANWQTGKKIVDVEQHGEERAVYGSNLLAKLSKDLNKLFGKGFSERNLQYARQFYRNYKLSELHFELGWTHYRVLLQVKEESDRKSLERKAISGDWSHRELLEYIKANRIGVDGKKTRKIGLLKRPQGVFNHYRSYENFSSNSARSVRNLDLGFNVFTEILFSSEGIKFKDGTIVEAIPKGKSFELRKSKVSENEIFTFKAFPERVVDGDTILVRIDLGFGIFTRQRLRLRGINSPEKNSKGGEKASAWLAKKLNPLKFIVIRTHGRDIYGRYLTDVLYSENFLKKEDVLREGIFLNNELLESNVAVVE